MKHLLAASLILAAFPAHAYRTNDGYRISGDASSFTVDYKPGSAARDYWCAAGEFALRRLQQNPTVDIYRLSPRPLSRGEGMTFSLYPEGAIDTTGIAVFPDDGSLSAGFADSLCYRGPRTRF